MRIHASYPPDETGGYFILLVDRTNVLYGKEGKIHPMRRMLLIIIITLSLGIGASTLTRGHQWGDDFAWYIVQAKSILDGSTNEFMQQSAFTNGESTTHLGPLAYPWGYPLILAPVYATKGISPLALKLPGLFFTQAF